VPLGAKQFVDKMSAKQPPSKGAFEAQREGTFKKGFTFSRNGPL
jgi:hypothetical protein